MAVLPVPPVPRRYDEEDEALLMQADADVLHERKRLQDSWNEYMQVRRLAVSTVPCAPPSRHSAGYTCVEEEGLRQEVRVVR